MSLSSYGSHCCNRDYIQRSGSTVQVQRSGPFSMVSSRVITTSSPHWSCTIQTHALSSLQERSRVCFPRDVRGLPIGELPYEEYVPGTEELHLLKDASQVYETYWKVLYHYHICIQITRLRAGGVKQMSWANYLFQNLGKQDRPSLSSSC